MSRSEAAVWSLQDWLDTQRELQVGSFNVDPVVLTGEELRDYWCWNLLAAHSELDELARELRWKPWAINSGVVRDRANAVEEVVDLLHFVGNLALTVGATGEELTEAYKRKAEVNRQRQKDGYRAR